MEKTQTSHSGHQHRNDNRLRGGSRAATALEVNYLVPDDFTARRFNGHLLGAVAFGSARLDFASADCPFAWVDMPVLNRDAVIETWTSRQPVVREDAPDISGAHNEDILFGCLQMDADRLNETTFLAYCRLFDFIDSHGYGHLLRVWHYFPQINASGSGLERYQQFSVGRHEAFALKGRRMLQRHAPAACALGSRSGLMVVYFLAARRPGQPLENPRQISAYHYPAQYGPRSPAFSRAMLAQLDDEPLMFISGTASIVGHETLHAGDADAQARETVSNLVALIGESKRVGQYSAGTLGNPLLKAYVRRPEYAAILEKHLVQTFGSGTNAVYLQADICRADLLIEVEGVCLNKKKIRY